jgi:hypothetical protein
VFNHDFQQLLGRNSIRQYAAQCSHMSGTKTEDKIIKHFETKLLATALGQCLHYGIKHTSTKSKKIKLPSQLLTFLWMLCYCIYNKESLDNMKRFLAPDTFKTPESMRESPILTVDFFQEYILSSVETINHDAISNKKEFLSQQLRKHYISPNDRNLFPKIQEFIYYSTASEFIKIMLHYKGEPKFKVYNEHMQKLEDILPKSTNSDSSQKERCLVRKSKNLYELFFSSVPNLILLHQCDHWNQHRAQNCFGPNTTIENSTVSLPIQNENGNWEAISFIDVLDKILYGKNVLSLIIKQIENSSSSEESEEESEEENEEDEEHEQNKRIDDDFLQDENGKEEVNDKSDMEETTVVLVQSAKKRKQSSTGNVTNSTSQKEIKQTQIDLPYIYVTRTTSMIKIRSKIY